MQAWSLVLTWGARLLARRPAQTSALAVHLCLARRSAAALPAAIRDEGAWGEGPEAQGEGGVAALLQVFAEQPRWQCHLLEQLAGQPPQPQAPTAPPPPLLLPAAPLATPCPPPGARPLAPHPSLPSAPQVVYHLLLDLYLSEALEPKSEAAEAENRVAVGGEAKHAGEAVAEPQPPPLSREARQAKALELLRGGEGAERRPYDEGQALLLCAQHRCGAAAL